MSLSRWLATAAAFTGLATLTVSTGSSQAAANSGGTGTRINEIQVVATHNSYHRELSGAEQRAQLEIDPGANPNLYYSHAPLTEQLAEQEVRSVELDVVPDPKGGLYRWPLVRKNAGLPPLEDPAWGEPGTKVFHMVDADYNTTCVQLTQCLKQVRGWSRKNPGHVPLLIMLEFKASEDRFERLGGVESPPWEESAFRALEDEIRSVFDSDDLITPDDVRRPGLTLEQSVLRHGWPTVARSAGKVMFAMDNTNQVRTSYLEGHSNLEGRVLFTDSAPGTPSAAFMKRNDPTGKNEAEIADLVKRGYIVRTRADVAMSTVLGRDTAMREAALGSGAQIVSTDFPAAGMSARYDRDYFVSLPGPYAARCNPVSAARTCRDGQLER
ncbi:phosphatidylinositol-specific phospholipase C1-like protein [Streptomyces pathocidini]|uniref:Phosphatidylinositol-specific phospholipase C1-like protein n=1 Tax=Streptomyces pathocidini TaxID=1650571 RepID=A0ABW7UJF2_9ACTN|nr:phosphatidylinositol-specific phospholipase C1-like protein [Streptomyces pathocidini]